ncbi:MAG: M28 family peptidase [Firmicutes bacterium]|nr:M28 family peptidase [Bacillota bacterium]
MRSLYLAVVGQAIQSTFGLYGSAKTHYTYKDVEVANVIGIIPGVDEDLQDSAIIIGAHLGHVGENKDGTYQPGALDNASGVAAMMEIAGTLQAAGFSRQVHCLYCF